MRSVNVAFVALPVSLLLVLMAPPRLASGAVSSTAEPTRADPSRLGGAVPVSPILQRPLSVREQRRLRNEGRSAIVVAPPSTKRPIPSTTTTIPAATVVPTTVVPVVPATTVVPVVPATTVVPVVPATTVVPTVATTVVATTVVPTVPTSTTRGLGPTRDRVQTPGSNAPLATTTTTAVSIPQRVDGALTASFALADGAFVFEPPSAEIRPTRRKRDATRQAVASAPRGARKITPEVFFGLFKLDSPKQRTADGRLVPVFDQRPVWVAVFRNVATSRAQVAQIPDRRSSTTTTVDPKSLLVTSNYLYVIDDRTGIVLIRSEFGA